MAFSVSRFWQAEYSPYDLKYCTSSLQSKTWKVDNEIILYWQMDNFRLPAEVLPRFPLKWQKQISGLFQDISVL